jgi:peptidoglycan/xylan/chitin deacetylase (PgdA/CDA1 family)
MLRRVRVAGAHGTPVAWAEGMAVSLPGVMLDRQFAGCVTADGIFTIPRELPDLPVGAAASVRDHAAYTERGPASSRSPISYRRVPGPIRRAMGAVIGRWSRRSVDTWATFPQWPLDLSADFLADLSGPSNAPPTPTPVCLTHDLDSAEGLSNLMASFLPIEERAGARSTNFVVPCAWPLDTSRLDDVVSRGHELGIHGYDHRNRTPFVDRAEMRARLDAARALQARFDMRGYRAPSLLRTRGLLEELSRLYAYDSSMPTSGGRFPVPNNGCATARPFAIGPLLEVPVSMPRDGSLRFLGYRPDEILRLWIDTARTISASRGVVVLLTHCERGFSGNAAMLDIYARFVRAISEDARYRWSTLAGVAR